MGLLLCCQGFRAGALLAWPLGFAAPKEFWQRGGTCGHGSLVTLALQASFPVLCTAGARAGML